MCFRAALACIGALFEHLGRFLAGFFRDTLTNLLKAMKSAEVCLHLLITKTFVLSLKIIASYLGRAEETIVRKMVNCLNGQGSSSPSLSWSKSSTTLLLLLSLHSLTGLKEGERKCFFTFHLQITCLEFLQT